MYYTYDKHGWYTGTSETLVPNFSTEVPPNSDYLNIHTNIGKLRSRWLGPVWVVVAYQDFDNPERITQADIDAGSSLPLGELKPNIYA